MPEIKLLIKEKTPCNQVVLGAKSEKLPFTLTANITEIASAESEETRGALLTAPSRDRCG